MELANNPKRNVTTANIPTSNQFFGIMDKIQAILEMIASNGQNSGCFFV